MSATSLDTPIGPVTVSADEDGIAGVEFGADTGSGRADADATGAAEQLRAYFAGESRSFDAKLDWQRCSAFQREVLTACDRIPYGETATYAQLAAEIGRPGAARAVGTALRTNPWPVLIPCHRVIRSDGQLGAYAGRPNSPAKRWLLDHERSHLDSV